MACLLGLDAGLTVTKAVLFDEDGTALAAARRAVAQSQPRPRHVERDMDALWEAAADAIRGALGASGRRASDVAAVAATAHGDGLTLLDGDGRPLGPGVLSLDSRGADVVAGWERDGTAERALALTGQAPHAAAPATLLAWVREHEPERFARIGHVVACKDWLRLKLTGEVGTDRTEASASLADLYTGAWSEDALALYGLGAVAGALPPIADPCAVVGRVAAGAAARTGLAEGTPVAAGLHDVVASALGIGAHAPGTVAVIAGTYSINAVVTEAPRTDPRWMCRAAATPGAWNAMAISPASSANYDWLRGLVAGDLPPERVHAALLEEAGAGLADNPPPVLFHPYLYGSPHGPGAGAALLGLRGWHGRGEVVAAVLEGIAFNHRHHVDALREGFDVREARLTGGVSRAPAVARLFADVLDMPVTVPDVPEAAAWGAALCAGTAAGLYPSPREGPAALAARAHAPDPARAAARARRYEVHARSVAALAPIWAALGEA